MKTSSTPRAVATLLAVLWALALADGCGSSDPKTCADLTCSPRQICQEGEPPECIAACEIGFAWNGSRCVESVVATCRPLPADGSILLRCEMEQRACLEAQPGQAVCGSCKAGFVEVGGACVARQTCDELACSRQNRQCEANPNAACTTCLQGFVEDGGACREPKTCNDVTCMPGFSCTQTPGFDAECRMGGCAANEVPRASGQGCVRCFLDCAGRPGATGRVFPGAATLADTCVCETQPGWFWDEGAFGGGDVRPCDEDGDGWVRVTAKRALDRTDDRAVRDNARCDVRSITTVRLVSDEGGTRDVALSRPAQLFEAERIDDPELLADAVAQGSFAQPEGRPFRAEELNTLTKACVWKATNEQRADFNQNNVEDPDEAHDDPRLDDPNDPLSPLYDFAYFVELNRGWYEAPATGAAAGTYVIQERARAQAPVDPTLALPLAVAMSDGGEFWRQCSRLRDAAYREGTPGHDFARFTTGGTFTGMGHASQFRCLRVVSQPTGRAHEATPEQIAAEWTVSRCVPGETRGPAAAVDATNPSEPAFTCTLSATPEPRTSTTAPVLLAAAKYLPYDDEFNIVAGRPTYVRGCVNECRERPFLCPGYDPIDAGAQCVGAPRDFGRLQCGCGRGFAGPGCELACPGDLGSAVDGVGSLFTSPSFEAAPRQGIWMCGASTSGGSAPLVGQVAGSTRTWGLVGDIGTPATVPTTEACAPDGSGGCTYRLRGSAL